MTPDSSPGSTVCTSSRCRTDRDRCDRRRPLSYAERDAVYNELGIPRGTRSTSPRRGYRIDHLIPLELGGANDVHSLWPQRFADSEVKDRVESALHEAVCVEHTLSLKQAQAAIARDWTRIPVGIPPAER